MQEKMKWTQQKDENLVQVQQQCSVYFCIKRFLNNDLFWLIKCVIMMILTMTKYHGNLVRDSSLSLLAIVKFFSSLETKMILKIPNKSFLKITQYMEPKWKRFDKQLRTVIHVSVNMYQIHFAAFPLSLLGHSAYCRCHCCCCCSWCFCQFHRHWHCHELFLSLSLLPA